MNKREKYLPAVAMAYRSLVHKSTKKSPFELNHGRLMALPLNLNNLKLNTQHLDQ